MTTKKTKIVCTVGPATEKQESLEKLLKAGMNVMRLNFSHGDFAEHQARITNLKKAVASTGIGVAVLQDLAGPKIRIGNFKTESVTLVEGKKFTITTEDIIGDENRVSINYPLFPKEVRKGHIVFIHDGKKKLEVLEVKGKSVICKVVVGGDIKGRRGVNLPDSDLSVAALTEKDKKDIEFGIKNKVDFFALSFVRNASDITELRNILNTKKSKAKIIAKIETPQAIRNIDEILTLADGLMVARGDLAIEIPAEQVPKAQKMLIRKCNEVAKPVITATQMLESMIQAPVPTRAEVSDVANAIMDGTDAVMLSEETTLGAFPIKAVEVMSKVALETEMCMTEQLLTTDKSRVYTSVESVTASAVKNADRVGARFLVSFTNSGQSARSISRHKPAQPIVVFTPNEITYRQSFLTWGAMPVMAKRTADFNEVAQIVRDHFLKSKLAKKGDKVVMASTLPFGKGTETNMILVETL
ncbi:MAG: pyruvate kinase [Candidatus Taylorbacteria bacterium CG10_big_fil_rev_8_21_14_0_10_41_48]|uniref:Pyruvate kinase n=1 Tax=Candidatus Taylorbacteria bacterium CG10_big_fil_rev_8_21_14_0_10_41_48 TaxID=1975024 RepID=A0A2M8LB79_9BACT|nr:MAG: pyruvate kinase [Candidatus Taylorbacteria bacterium CG10_big_fil_rev_8_21_14_0_10_41_48]